MDRLPSELLSSPDDFMVAEYVSYGFMWKPEGMHDRYVRTSTGAEAEAGRALMTLAAFFRRVSKVPIPALPPPMKTSYPELKFRLL